MIRRLFGCVVIAFSTVAACMENIVTIDRLPYEIVDSGAYIVSEKVRYFRKDRDVYCHTLIRVKNNANVVINLNNQILNGSDVLFAIDANGANSIFVSNGTIFGSYFPLSSHNNRVWLCDLRIANTVHKKLLCDKNNLGMYNVRFIDINRPASE